MKHKILDLIGMLVSLLCGLHCLLLPIAAFGGFAFLGLNQDHDVAHTFLLLATVAFASATAGIGTYVHKDVTSWKYVFLAGLVMALSIAFHELVDSNAVLHSLPMVVFAALLVIAHYKNLRAWHSHNGHKACGCSHTHGE